MSKRKSLVMCVVLGLLAASIGLSTASAKPDQQRVQLRLLYPSGGGQAAMEIIVKNFERVYPNIDVQEQYLPSTSITPLLMTQFQGGNAPDIFPLNNGRASVDSVWLLADEKRLLDLSGRKWNKRIPPGVRASVMRQGKVYAWPAFVNTFAVIYNNELFSQLGLKVPTRFSEVLAMCAKINAAGKIPFVQAWGNVAAGSIVGRQRAVQHVYAVDQKWNEKRLQNKVTFAGSPLWRRAIQSVVDMKNAKCFQEGAAGTSRPQQYSLFARGDAVMSFVAASELTNFTAINPNLKVTMFNMPGDTPKQARLLSAPSVVLAASAATQYPAHVRTFIDFFAREKQSSLFATVSGAISVLDAKKAKVPEYMKRHLAPYFASGNIQADLESTWGHPLVFETYRQGVLGLFTGQTTVDGILAEMDRVWNTRN
jgi:raffinose/stachyose/melibiose transport system substrate-binding protein